ncbi:ATPase [Anopheles sinensis]|uniref:ATPase n=1 Tax=Anopheles sinensis TaxID=74873 RepID=A0A084VXS9_ANOSI|nr:ATPase [Anopheles sinensis]
MMAIVRSVVVGRFPPYVTAFTGLGPEDEYYALRMMMMSTTIVTIRMYEPSCHNGYRRIFLLASRLGGIKMSPSLEFCVALSGEIWILRWEIGIISGYFGHFSIHGPWK